MFVTEKEIRQPNLGKNLTRIRKAHGITQEQVADILKIKRSTYAYYERNVTPSLEILDKLCTLFNVGLDDLIYGGPRLIHGPGGRVADSQGEKNFGMLRDNEWQLVLLYRMLPDSGKLKVIQEANEQRNKVEKE